MTDAPTYTSPLLHRPGAAALPGDHLVDATGVAWHYGNPLGEQRAAETGSMIVDRSHRRVLRVTGPDAAAFLSNLLSQQVVPGQAAQALDLNMQGHVLHTLDFAALAPAETEGETASAVVYVDTTAAEFASLQDYLQRMIFWSQVEITPVYIAIISVLGKPLAPTGAVFSRTILPGTPLGVPRHDYGVPRQQLAAAVAELEAAGGKLAGLMAYTAERVRAREPELAADLDGKTIPHEVPHWIGRGTRPGAVHLEKGCYRGQETVARVENIGKSPRLLVVLHLDGSAPSTPLPGADITAGGRRVGRLGTVVDDCDYGPLALGLVKRSALDQPLQIGDVSATVEPTSIPADEGPKAGRLAQQRLRGQ